MVDRAVWNATRSGDGPQGQAEQQVHGDAAAHAVDRSRAREPRAGAAGPPQPGDRGLFSVEGGPVGDGVVREGRAQGGIEGRRIEGEPADEIRVARGAAAPGDELPHAHSAPEHERFGVGDGARSGGGRLRGAGGGAARSPTGDRMARPSRGVYPGRGYVAAMRLVPLVAPRTGPGRLLGRPHRGAARGIARVDADRLVTIGDDGVLVVWSDDRPERRVTVGGPLRAVAASRKAVAVGGAGGLAVIETEAWTIRHRHPSPADAAAIVGKEVVFGGSDGEVRHLAEDGSVRERRGPGGAIAAVLGVGGGVAVCDGRLLLWRSGEREVVHDLYELAPEDAHGATVRPHPDPDRIFVGVVHEVMCLYIAEHQVAFDPATGAAAAIEAGGADGTEQLWPLPGGAVLAIGSGKGGWTGCAFDARRGVWRLAVPGVDVTGVQIDDERTVYTVDASGALRRFCLGAPDEAPIEAGAFVAGTAAADTVVTWQPRTSTIRWWSVDDGTVRSERRWRYHAGQTLHRSPGGRLVARGDQPSAGSSAQLLVIDEALEVMWDASARIGSPGAAGVSRDGRVAVATGDRFWVQTIDADLRRYRHPTDHLAYGFTAHLPTGQIVVGGQDGHLGAWAPDGLSIWSIRGEPIAGVAALSGGVVVFRREEALLHDAQTGRVLRRVPLATHVGDLPRAAEREDGEVVLVCGSVAVWSDGGLRSLPGTEGMRPWIGTGRYWLGDLGYDRPTVLVDAQTGAIHPIALPREALARRALVPGGQRAVLGDGGEVCVIDLPSATTRRWTAHDRSLLGIAADSTAAVDRELRRHRRDVAPRRRVDRPLAGGRLRRRLDGVRAGPRPGPRPRRGRTAPRRPDRRGSGGSRARRSHRRRARRRFRREPARPHGGVDRGGRGSRHRANAAGRTLGARSPDRRLPERTDGARAHRLEGFGGRPRQRRGDPHRASTGEAGRDRRRRDDHSTRPRPGAIPRRPLHRHRHRRRRGDRVGSGRRTGVQLARAGADRRAGLAEGRSDRGDRRARGADDARVHRVVSA